jgi:hypothetical protein
MSKLSFRLIFIFYIAFSIQVDAQEVLFPLTENAVIKQYLKSHVVSNDAAYRVQAVNDTISLPFLDDFSGSGIYPVDSNWIDSAAFINSTFGDRPPTIGVATLDGIDKLGNPYNPFSGATGIADFLTSKPIHISPSDTGVWLSFFYQPQGLGDQPESMDSLVLQFFNSSGEWNSVWDTAGNSNRAFKRKNIHITDPQYLYDGFQFRFMNYATLNGNRDHWNIDYVWLAKNRNNNDSIAEISFINPIKSYLSEFSSMPYKHYKHLVTQSIDPLRTTIRDTVRTFTFTGSSSLQAFYKIEDENGNVIQNTTFTSGSYGDLGHNTDYGVSNVLPSDPDNVFDANLSSEFADFYVKHYFSATNAGLKTNDVSNYTQHFKNYYAYDDGTAEIAYGIPEAGAKIAYRFNVKMQDTLIGAEIYFNQVGAVVHNNLFQLCYWSDINIVNNTDVLVHNMIDNHPANIDSINGFATYIFDVPQVVSAGPIYIGWIQNDATQLGIGIDKNTIATSNMFTKFTSSGILKWRQSTTQGAWMMRPLFKSSLPLGINEQEASAFLFNVYPNPASTEAFIDIHVENKELYNYELFNNLGESILRGHVSSGKLNISGLANGFYFIRVMNTKTNDSVTKKLIVQQQ